MKTQNSSGFITAKLAIITTVIAIGTGVIIHEVRSGHSKSHASSDSSHHHKKKDAKPETK